MSEEIDSETVTPPADAAASVMADPAAASPAEIGTADCPPAEPIPDQSVSSEQTKVEQPQTHVNTSKSATIGIELAALRCIVEYGGADGVRAKLKERTQTDPKFEEILEYFDAWDAGNLPQYLEQRFPMATPPAIKIVSERSVDANNAPSAH
jgi:hypothetical protein